jgi:mono/diheme cytochrome c family protein
VKIRTTLAGLLAMAFPHFHAWAQGHASTRDGVYTDSQASRGEASYKKACASCHGETLEGSGAATPPLAGPDFTMNWSGQTLDDLFERIQTSMPADHPGTLSRADNADIIAHILRANKLPSGKNELSGDADALKQIRFDAPK